MQELRNDIQGKIEQTNIENARLDTVDDEWATLEIKLNNEWMYMIEFGL